MADMDIGGMLEQFLSDPDTGEKIRQAMNALSGGNPEGNQPALDSSSSDSSLDINNLLKIKSLLTSANSQSDSRVILLNALRPYLSEKRSKSVDLAVRFLKLSKMASLAGEMGVFKDLV